MVKGARQREWPRHLSTHTHTQRTLPTTISVLETPFKIHISSVYQTHTCMQATYTLYISQKDTQLRVKDSTHNVHPYAQVRYTSHLQSSYAVMRQLLYRLFLRFYYFNKNSSFLFIFLFYYEGPRGLPRFLLGSPRQHFGSLRLSILRQGKPWKNEENHYFFRFIGVTMATWDI